MVRYGQSWEYYFLALYNVHCLLKESGLLLLFVNQSSNSPKFDWSWVMRYRKPLYCVVCRGCLKRDRDLPLFRIAYFLAYYSCLASHCSPANITNTVWCFVNSLLLSSYVALFTYISVFYVVLLYKKDTIF